METSNPFENTKELVNLATGKTARPETKSYLLATLERVVQNRLIFESECKDDSSRFQKVVGKTKVLNFAAENVKPKSLPHKIKAAEGVRDVFAKLLAVESKTGSRIDLKHVLKYPVTDVPMALPHIDGTMYKTDKSSLTNFF